MPERYANVGTQLGAWRRPGPGFALERAKSPFYRLCVYCVALAFAAFFTAPFIWTVTSSLKDPTELYIFPPKLLPSTPQWANYAEVWRQVPFGRFFVNSTTVTGLAMVGQIASATLVAYGFARFAFAGRNSLFLLVLSTMILPYEVILIPQFLLFLMLGWLDSYKPLVIPSYFGGGAFYVFLMRQFFMTIPLDLDESAKIDGASSLRILVSILLPLCKPILATVTIFSFLGHWNDFLVPLIYLNSMRKYTLPIGLRFFQQDVRTGGAPREHFLMAASLMAAVPEILLFIVAQRYFISGIVMSGIKG